MAHIFQALTGILQPPNVVSPYREQNISFPCQDQTFIPLLSSPFPTLTEIRLFSLLKALQNYLNCENRTNSLINNAFYVGLYGEMIVDR
jgi:hypothetical protein